MADLTRWQEKKWYPMWEKDHSLIPVGFDRIVEHDGSVTFDGPVDDAERRDLCHMAAIRWLMGRDGNEMVLLGEYEDLNGPHFQVEYNWFGVEKPSLDDALFSACEKVLSESAVQS